MIVGVLKESLSGERRVALIPAEIPRLAKRGVTVRVETGAGDASGAPDAEFEARGAAIGSRDSILAEADIILAVRWSESAPVVGLRHDQIIMGFMNPLGDPAYAATLAKTGVRAMSLELIPRITRAQSMDALSAMATIAGYHAVLTAAVHVPKLFPMLMTAAGTLTAARVFVLGAGVAGLQAIATAKRLGAQVEAYDVRPEVKDQVQSVGGKFISLDLETEDAGDKGGYAKAQSDDFYKRQQAQLAETIRAADVVITTAAIPGRKAPVLVTEAMMKGMRPGSVIVDLAAETGGNVEGTRAGETVVRDGVRILGPKDVPSEHAAAASQMLARNFSNLIQLITDKEGDLAFNTEDDVISGCLVTDGGAVVHPRVSPLLEGDAS